MKYDVNYIQSEFGLYGFGTIDIKMDEVDVAGIKSRTCFEDIILFTIMYVVIGSIAGLIMFRWFGVFLPLVGGIGVLILYSFISKYIAWPKASFVMKRESIKDITLKERTVEFTAEHPVLEELRKVVLLADKIKDAEKIRAELAGEAPIESEEGQA